MFKHLEKSTRNAARTVLVPLAIRALRAQAAGAKTTDDIAELALRFRHLGIRITAQQVPSEIKQLLRLVADLRPRTILEVGTYKGGTFFMYARVAEPDALLISLDLPPGRMEAPTGGFDVGYTPWQARLFRSFAREQQRIELVQADSHDPKTAGQIRGLLAGRAVDFLFIDGDHSYPGVKADYEMYSPLVRPGGVIAFHDIVPGPEARVGGVPRFWQELKQGRDAREFVADWNQQAFGIGVIIIPEA
jgi:cephalosporin hydroxylase